MGEHKQCRDAECNICRGDTHVIGPNPDTARRRAMCYLDDYGEWREDPNTSTTEAALAESRREVERLRRKLAEIRDHGFVNADGKSLAKAALEAPHESTR